MSPPGRAVTEVKWVVLLISSKGGMSGKGTKTRGKRKEKEEKSDKETCGRDRCKKSNAQKKT